MAIDESIRHAMFTRLEEILGKPTANALMEHLPPVGWADVATKRDLENLELRLESRFRADLMQQTRTFLFATVGTMVSLVAVLLVAVR